MTETSLTPTAPQGTQASFPTGQQLRCEQCGAQIAIIKPCSCQPPHQILRCCGKEMVPVS